MNSIKHAIRIVLFYLIVFVICLFAFSAILNRGKAAGSLKSSEAGLPVVYVRAGGHNINEMHGYTQDVDAGYIRDTLTPVTDSKTINLMVRENNYSIVSAAYELYNDQYTQQILSGECTDLERNDAQIQMKIGFDGNLYSNREYVLRILLTDSEGSQINYYTRVRYGSDLKVAEKLEFILDFNEATFDKKRSAALETYLESSSSSSSDLSFVNLYSSKEAVTWGSLEPFRTADLNIDLKEINTETAAFTLSYEVESNADDINTTYLVREFYRLRWTSDRVYLLDFEREMNEDISESDIALSGGAIRLGISDAGQVMYTGYGSEDQTYGCFQMNKQLWMYDSTNSILTKVYDGMDDDHDCAGNTEMGIKVMRCDPVTGDLYFVVYGYLHRGDYEGSLGIILYHFNYEEVSLEELMFIPYDRGFEPLKNSVDKLAYMNETEMYLMVGHTVYRIDPVLSRIEVAWDNLDNDNCAVSSFGTLVLTDGLSSSGRCGRSLRVVDLNDDSEMTISGGSYMIKPLGYAGDDLVYGLIDPNHIKEDSTGVVQLPMSEIHIVNRDLKDVKVYSKKNRFVREVDITDKNIELHLEKQMKNGEYTDYEMMADDFIIFNKKDDSHLLNMVSRRDGTRGYQNWLQFDSSRSLTPINQNARMLDPGYDVTKELEYVDEIENGFYVYSAGRLDRTFTSLVDAVTYGSNANAGATIISSHKQVVWQKAGCAYIWQLDIDGVDVAENKIDMKKSLIKAIASFEGWTVPADLEWDQTMFGAMTKGLEAETIDLTGLGLADALHFIYRDRVVVAKTGSNQYVLIVGFDQTRDHILIANPSSGEIETMDWDEAEELFKKRGSVYFSYLD